MGVSPSVAAFPFGSIGVLLIVACLMAMISRRFRLPYSVGLVAAGVGIAYLPTAPAIPLSRDLIFYVFLPPLVFEAALQLEWKPFRRELPITLLLALAGVAIAASVVAAGMHWIIGWSWIGAALFGVLIAATDPVSVIASFRELKVEPRLSMLVESESLLNDGVAAVGFAVLVGIAGTGSATAAAVVPAFLWTMIGGVLIGGIVAAAVLVVAGRTNDHLVEITLTTIAAYASFLTAEHLHASGVLACVAAGLVVGNVGWLGAISDEGREHVMSAWDYFAFLANSFVFFLIGLHEAAQPIHQLGWRIGVTAILLVLLGRVLAVYPLSALFRSTRLAIPVGYQHVLVWGGLRGALALALALALPPSVPERLPIIVTAFLVVAFSIFAQGLTMPLLIRGLRLAAKPDAASQEGVAAPSQHR
jgi:CPA1 family monovalent cation:H+ antiporter